MNFAPWFALIIGVFFVVIGGLNAARPQMMWSMNQRMNSWQYKNGALPQASSAYLTMMRVIGIVFVAIGIGLAIYAIAHL